MRAITVGALGLALLVATESTAATLCSLQRGTVLLLRETADGGSDEQTVNVSIAPVDPTKTMLWFSRRSELSDVSGFQVLGQLFADRLTFTRTDRTQSPVTVVWTAAEFCDGVTVSRGKEAIDANTLIPVPRFEPTQSLMTATLAAATADYHFDKDNLVLAYPDDPTTLRVQHGGTSGNTEAAWQLLQSDGLRVLRGRTTMGVGTSAVAVPATVPSNSFARVTWRGLLGAYGDLLVTARVGTGGIELLRGTDAGIVDAEWEVVQFVDGTRVFSDRAVLPSASFAHSVTLPTAVDLSRSVCFLAGHENYGVSSKATLGTITTRFESATTLEFERAETSDKAVVDWVVLEFPPGDAGVAGADAGTTSTDAGAAGGDAGTTSTDAGADPKVEILSSPPTSSATCHQEWRYAPSAEATARVVWSLRAVDAELPAGLFVNTESGEVSFRPIAAGAARFELIASAGGRTAAQRIDLDVTCSSLAVGSSCAALPGPDWGSVGLLFGAAVLARRLRRRS